MTGALLLCTLAPVTGRAAESCEIEVAAELGPAWREAIPPLASEDCAQLRLAPNDAGVRLTFVTRAGDRAQRQLADASEVGAAVEALRVGLPPMAAGDAELELRELAPLPPSASRAPEAEVRGIRLLLVLASGARGGPPRLMSPLLAASAVLTVHAWELGVTLGYDLRYFDLERRAPENRQTGTFALGILAGRRDPLGDLALVWGGRATLALLASQSSAWSGPADGSVDAGELEGSPFEGRFGAYVGLSFPNAASMRFRTELGADVAVASRARSVIVEDAAADVPFTPTWALSATIGLELAP